MNTTDIVSAAAHYVNRGWTVIQLHQIHADTCSCGSADPVHVYKQGGKHPVAQGWQSPEPWTDRHGRTWPSPQLRTEADVREAWAARPGANVGIVTGRASNFWVLDVDPDNNGHTVLAGLVSAFGVLPETYTVLTGSGGMHYYWQLPEWEPHANRGRLPIGLDVRGWHGQVVAPPSVSGKGPYRVGSEAPIAAAPAWLLDMIRPPERVEVDRGSLAELIPAQREEMGAVFYDRGQAYAATAVANLMLELAGAAPGTRNHTAYRVACRLLELIASDWSGLDGVQTYAGFMEACRYADTDGTFSEQEAAAVWASAMRVMAGRGGVPLPAADYYGSAVPFAALGGDAAGFSLPGTVPLSAVPGMAQPAPPILPPGAEPPVFVAPAGGLVDVGPASGGPEIGAPAADGGRPTVVMDPLEQAREAAIMAEMSRQWVREEAAKRLQRARQRPVDWSAELLDDDAIDSQPDPVWLVGGYLVQDSMARLVGASRSFKSFISIDLAACVSTGTSWHGRPVRRGLSVYVVAEGAGGIKKRLAAWRQRHQLERHGVLVIKRPVQVDGPEWASFVSHMDGIRPAMITFDTQARVTVGRNENDPTEMSEIVEALEQLRTATAACVLVVHHTGKSGSERGATSPFGAAETSLTAQRLGNSMVVEVLMTKQKDDVELAPLRLTMNVVGESLVPVGADEGVGGPGGLVFVPPANQDVGRVRAMALVSVMRDQFGRGNGGTRADIRTAYFAAPAIVALDVRMQRQAFNRAWGLLEERGRIARNPVADRFKFVEMGEADDLDSNPDSLTEFGWPIAKPQVNGTM